MLAVRRVASEEQGRRTKLLKPFSGGRRGEEAVGSDGVGVEGGHELGMNGASSHHRLVNDQRCSSSGHAVSRRRLSTTMRKVRTVDGIRTLPTSARRAPDPTPRVSEGTQRRAPGASLASRGGCFAGSTAKNIDQQHLQSTQGRTHSDDSPVERLARQMMRWNLHKKKGSRQRTPRTEERARHTLDMKP